MKKRIFSLALASTMVLGTFGTVMAADEVLENKPFVDGYPGGVFKPDNSITRGEVTKLVAVAKDFATQNSSYPDVQDHWANKYIGALSAYLKGYPDGEFKADNEMTRAEFATLMSRINDSDIKPSAKSFTDIGNHWAEDDIKRMAAAGVIEGYEDGTFKPDQPVTRAEAVTMILRNEGINPDPDIASKVTNPFSDVTNEAWYIEEVLTASGLYKYVQDENGNRKVVANDDVEKIESAKVIDKVITDESEDLLVELAVNGEKLPVDYASFYAEGYHISNDQWKVEDSKGNDASDIIVWKAIGGDYVPTLDPDEMDLDEVYTVSFPIAHQGNYFTVATGTVQKVKAANAKVKSLDSLVIKRESCDGDTLLDLKSDTLVGGFLDGTRDETAVLTKINATVNGGTLNLLDTSIAGDVKIESSNENVVEVKRGAAGEVKLYARMAGKATITVTYGDLKITKEITVVKEERKVREVKANVSEVNLLNGQSSTVIISLFDQYGDPFSLDCTDEDLTEYIHANIKGDAVVQVNSITPMNGNSKFEAVLEAVSPGTGYIYVTMIDDAYKNEVKVFKLPVNVTDLNTLGEKKVVVEDTAETKDYSKDFELDLNDSKDDKVLFNISQFTKEGAFSGKVKDLKFEIDNPAIISVANGTDDNFLVTAKKKGVAEITLRDSDDNVVAKVKVTVIDSEKSDEITGVNYRVDAKTTIKGAPLNAIGDYRLSDFVFGDAIKTNVASLSTPVIENGQVKVDGKVVGKVKVEVYTYDADDNATKTVIENANEADVLVTLADKDGERKAKVSVEVISNDGTEFDKVYELDLAK